MTRTRTEVDGKAYVYNGTIISTMAACGWCCEEMLVAYYSGAWICRVCGNNCGIVPRSELLRIDAALQKAFEESK